MVGMENLEFISEYNESIEDRESNCENPIVIMKIMKMCLDQ